MMASIMADNLSTRLASLSANPSRNPLRLRARAPMIASAYTYGVVRVGCHCSIVADGCGGLVSPGRPCGIGAAAVDGLRRPAYEGCSYIAAESDMRGLTAVLTIMPLLLGAAATMAQVTGPLQGNPFQRQGAAPVAPAVPLSSPAPRTVQPRIAAAPAGANQFPSEGAARQACGSDTVVWVNTGGSKAWHVSGDRYYGHTKHGAYMCGQTAQQAGYHPSGATAHPRSAGGGQAH